MAAKHFDINRQNYKAIEEALGEKRKRIGWLEGEEPKDPLESKLDIPNTKTEIWSEMLHESSDGKIRETIKEANARYLKQQAEIEGGTKLIKSSTVGVESIKDDLLQLAISVQKLCQDPVDIQTPLRLEHGTRTDTADHKSTSVTEKKECEELTSSENDPGGTVPEELTFGYQWRAFQEIRSKLKEQNYEQRMPEIRSYLKKRGEEMLRLHKLHKILKEVRCVYDPPREDAITMRFYMVSNTSFSSYRLNVLRTATIEHVLSQLPLRWNVSMESKFIQSSSLPKFNTPDKQIRELEGWWEYLSGGGVVFIEGEFLDP